MKKIFTFILSLAMLSLIGQNSIEHRGVPGPDLSSIRSGLIDVQELQNSSFTPEDLVSYLLPDGYTFSNVTYTGSFSAMGFFSGGMDANFMLDQGIVLGSGPLNPGIFAYEGGILNLAGDAMLDALGAGYETNDAAVLEFDFVPDGPLMELDLVFGSYEYPVAGQNDYEDVCGIFLDGANIAVFPGTSTEISITRTLNTDSPYYVSNDGTYGLGVSSLSTVLPLQAAVVPGNTYHMKIAIADDGDMLVESYIFLRGEGVPEIPLSNWALLFGLVLIAGMVAFRYWRMN